MAASKEYRSLADQTRALAGRAKDEHERDVLLRVSAHWKLLADYKETREALAFLERLPPQILAVELGQVERAER